MSIKRKYKTINVNKINVAVLHEKVRGKRIVLGVDVAKVDFLGVFMDDSNQALMTIKWESPLQVRSVIDLLKGLPVDRLEVAMESTSTYGDAFRYLLYGAGIRVFHVKAKNTWDTREFIDGVPSSHDAKAAYQIAQIHQWGKSEEWRAKTEERGLLSYIKMASTFHGQYLQNLNRLEAELARFWPELSEVLDISSTTALALLEEYGCPQNVARDPLGSEDLMRKASRNALSSKTKEQVVNKAIHTIGVVPAEEEVRVLQLLVSEIRRNKADYEKMKKWIEETIGNNEAVSGMQSVIGKYTAAVIYCYLGDPRNYDSSRKYLKAMGINLKERSSGKKKGQLGITKRGPGRVRQLLFLATLRLIQNDPVFKAWYDRKVARDGGKCKLKAILALERKLAMGLWHVGQGKSFQVDLLFDVERLNLTPSSKVA